ncbi:MAG: PDC sensor domain-containing protein [Candidatus Palauibacterales bacterium]|nr:PDC sensor domain-containing protein [Candidatus Palauibacterales bacterium]MDP2585060.1 PDC sensor domain-containing protein [Candidatus Palauibacterales bacterium]
MSRYGQPIPIAFTGMAMVATLLVSVPAAPAAAQSTKAEGKILAQRLVEAAQAEHPEADEIGIMASTGHGCVGIASTDKSDIGEKCETDDIKPMRTGKPSVGREEGGFDVSLPLHDSSGTLVGVVGIGFKSAPGQTKASVLKQARNMASEMEKRIPSKAKLLQHSSYYSEREKG